MSIWYFFSGLGKLIFSIKKAKKINAIVTNNSFTRKPIIELPILGPLLYLSCILFELN